MRQRSGLTEMCWVLTHETSNWSLQDDGILHKIKSSQLLRILLSSTCSVQALRPLRHQKRWLPGPFPGGKWPWREVDHMLSATVPPRNNS
jgi:hypothetical protein